MLEIELQFLYRGAAAPLVPTELAGFTLDGSTSFIALDTYYDTSVLDLRNAGCSLRVRQAENLARPQAMWKGPASRRPDGAKQREEYELELDHVPRDGDELRTALERADVWRSAIRPARLDAAADIHAIGQLRNDRSSHVYVQGLHRLDLTWDRLTYPLGPPEARIEVEVRTAEAARFLAEVEGALRGRPGSGPAGKVARALLAALSGAARRLTEPGESPTSGGHVAPSARYPAATPSIPTARGGATNRRVRGDGLGACLPG